MNVKEFCGNQSFSGRGFNTHLSIGGNYFTPNETVFLFVESAGLGEDARSGKEKKRQNQKTTCKGCKAAAKTPTKIDKKKRPHKM